MRTNRVYFGVLSLCLQLVFLHLAGFDDRLLKGTTALSGRDGRRAMPVGLHDYVLETAARLPCLTANLSGITYSPRIGALVAVVNAPAMVLILDHSGICRRKIPLVGFHDTEGIVWLEAERFAVVEERTRTVHIVHIDDQTSVLDRSDVIDSLQVDRSAKNNKGLEGIAYDAGNGRLFLVNEKRPRRLISVGNLVHQPERVDIRPEPALLPHRWFMKDLSGLHFDPRSRHLFLVSDESQCVVEVALNGRVVSQLDFSPGASGLRSAIPQAEGITMDDSGNVYVVGEPNEFYRFTPRDRVPI